MELSVEQARRSQGHDLRPLAGSQCHGLNLIPAFEEALDRINRINQISRMG